MINREQLSEDSSDSMCELNRLRGLGSDATRKNMVLCGGLFLKTQNEWGTEGPH